MVLLRNQRINLTIMGSYKLMFGSIKYDAIISIIYSLINASSEGACIKYL